MARRTETINQKQQNALEALMDSDSLTEAARKAGITRKTLYSYLRNDKAFARAYDDLQSRLMLERIDAISEAQAQAQRVTMELMNDYTQPAAIRLKAAQIICTMAEAEQERADKVIKQNLERDAFAERYL